MKLIRKSNKEPLSRFEKIQTVCSIVSTFLIGFLTVALSFYASSIANTQLSVSKAQMNPQFVIKQKSVYNEQNIVSDRIVEVSCQGGYFTNYKSNVFSVLELVCENNERYEIPLIAYWFAHEKTGNTVDLIEKMSYQNNVTKYFDLEHLILESYDNISYMELKHYMTISYYDFLQNEQKNYYEIIPIGGTTLIEESIYTNKKAHFDEMMDKGYYFDIDKCNSDDILFLESCFSLT